MDGTLTGTSSQNGPGNEEYSTLPRSPEQEAVNVDDDLFLNQVEFN